MTTIRLAYGGIQTVIDNSLSTPLPNDSGSPGLLVSFVYLKGFQKHRPKYIFRDWVLDSGAFSAKTLGLTIDLFEYMDVCKQLIKEDAQLVEVFALDVIGDWRTSLKNTEAMWKENSPAIPCYHVGEPWDVLVSLARDYPKVALGGVAREKLKRKLSWAEQCFARIWPKKIHGFGFGCRKSVLSLPWYSVDSSNWMLGPCGFGHWANYGNMSVYGGEKNVRPEIEYYLKMERHARFRWRAQLEELNGEDINEAAQRSSL